MRPVLQRLQRNPFALAVAHNATEQSRPSYDPQALWSCRTYGDGTNPKILEEPAVSTSNLESYSWVDPDLRHERPYKPLLAFVRKIDDQFRIRSWKERLVTFQQYQYESDLGTSAPSYSNLRLVDTLKYGRDFGLWLELVRFRQRHYGLEGLRVIWKEISIRELQLPCHGTTADELWSSFVRLGFEDPKVLKEIETFAIRQKASTAISWPKLYITILTHHLKRQPHHAYQWHARLHEGFPPSLEQLKGLFWQTVTNDAALGVFRRIYVELRLGGMYDTIIPELCNREKYRLALKWHNLLLRKHDIPSHASISEPLLHYLAVYGRHEHLVATTKGMVEAGVSFARPTRSTYQSSPSISREMMNRQLGETHGIAPKIISDEFCAQLFATKMFTVDIVINGLRVLGVEAIGPLSLKEIGSREKGNSQAICIILDRLDSAGISIGNSKFSTLVRRLALEDKRGLLNNVLTCDLHPDTYEDRNLQESLLASYHQTGDQLQIDRTLAILTINSPHWNLAAEHWNLLLRVYLARRDLGGIQRILETMREMHLIVNPRSSSYVRACMLSRRQVGRRPYRTNELPAVINIWREILQRGGVIPPVAWREVLKRLGMSGQLEKFEGLSLWLADWYSDPAVRASHLNLASPQRAGKAFSMLDVPRRLSRRHPLHPIRKLFPTVMQQAMVTWGFQHRLSCDDTERLTRSDVTGRSPWTWGLQLLLKLRQRRVIVARSTVARICRQRLKVLFGPGLSNRKINRRTQQVNMHHLSQYLDQMHAIWGPNLFDEADRLLIDPLHRRSRRSQLKHWITAKPNTPHITKYMLTPKR